MTLSTQRVSQIKDSIKRNIDQYFVATLGRENDIINIVNALIFRESSFNVNSIGPDVGNQDGTGRNYYYSSAIFAKVNSGTPTEVANIGRGTRALGLMQVMGWNLVKGGSSSGICEIDRLRPDISPSLVVLPGQDPGAHILGESNIDSAIKAGLIILEGKYKAVRQTSTGFTIGKDPYARIFNTRISAAVACYLGRGLKDINGTTPETYASDIIGGAAYQIANGGSTFKIADSTNNVVSTNGPNTNGSTLAPIGTAGCSS